MTVARGAWQEVLRVGGGDSSTNYGALQRTSGLLTCEQFGDGLVLTARRADEEQPGGQELVVAGQELSDGPGGARGGSLLSLTQLAAFVDGVHQQKERLLRGLHAQERKEDTSVDKGEADVTDVSNCLQPDIGEIAWKLELIMCPDLMQNSPRKT